jgi:hypothetical protein
MTWYAGIMVIVILVALPIIVRLCTGAWGNEKGFRETWSASRNAPGIKERQRKKNFMALALLLFGLPLGLLLVSLCEWLRYPRAIYVPVVTGIMFLSSSLLAFHFYDRKSTGASDKT